MGLKIETARELKGGAWRTPELNVMYSVHIVLYSTMLEPSMRTRLASLL